MSGWTRGWRWAAGAVVVLTAATASWTAPGAPAAASAAGEPAGPVVSHPWQPGRPQLGVQVYWVDTPADTDDVVRLKARRVLDHVVGMEANAVSVSFPFFTDAVDASGVYVDERTPSPERLAIVLAEAREIGLRTTVRPLLDEANLIARDSLDWRGRLDPADRDAWYASYRAFLDPYLAVAEREDVDTVVVAAELNSLQADPHWGPLVEHARTVYSGEIGYAANWDAYAEALDGVPADTVGIDAYPQLGVAPTASVPEMTAAWRAWLDDAAPPRPGLLLYEVGAAAEARTVDNPAVPHTEGAPLDQGVQRRWLAAACQVARDRELAGLYLWKIEFDVDPAGADPAGDLHDSFLGREAERTMRDCFASWGAVP
ncbi:glycoside hydrolase family 113 [Pseudonocardia humida]|uniref:Glycosyl hydrolase family 26 n=1 Tax=Pseudonocardia humida TaxID=2800819 RepID=A0ABT1A580_9PSEU|nr:hypothetical protein [Pseudonocardia humida]MCO1658086.1 hypothetical protein [Pseudonocardia humida]